MSKTKMMEHTINLSYLVALCDGDDEFMGTIIASFVDEMPELLGTIQRKMQAGDWKSVGELAHKMKPSVQFVGMDDTVTKAKSIEQHCREAEVCPDRVSVLVSDVTEETEKAIVALRQLLEQE